MTITYTHKVANARLGGFSSLLLRWKGSVYKLFYKEFLIYISLYTVLSLAYRCIPNPEFRESFEKLCLQFQSYTDLVPISFVLGFYVSMVVGRWWCQYESIPWPDSVMMMVTANVHGSDNRGRLIRRTLLRYLNLAQVLTYRSVSTAVFKRFPTIQHVINAGFMTETEYRLYENVKTKNVKYWVPCVWFSSLLCKVRQEGRIYDDMTYNAILKAMNAFRISCGTLFSYDWISIPLVYTQVVTVAVYVFFMSTLLSRQYLDVTKSYSGHEVDLYVPIFTICQFFFYVGWLKVAEQLINPFGEDDDDFEVNFIIDRNFEISMLTVDNMYMTHPKLERDMYWNNPNPSIPYTAAAASHKMEAFLGSTIDMRLAMEEMQLAEQGHLNCSKEKEFDSKGLDLNHNAPDFNIKTEEMRLLIPTVDINEPWKRSTEKEVPRKAENSLVASIRNHFMSRSQEKERDMKKSLLSLDFLKTRLNDQCGNTSVKDGSIAGEEDKPKVREDIIPSSESDSDDGESDVGDGTDDDDDVHESISQRRSSLSSEDEESAKDKHKLITGSSSSLLGKKLRVEPLEDRPLAKKAKSNAHQVLNKISMKISPKLRRPDTLVASETEGPRSGHRSILSRGRKSPRKRSNVGKFLKRNEADSRKGGETEQERRNAEMRTIGLLKSSRKKSVQALQRNARRTNYPGNAWLRHQYPAVKWQRLFRREENTLITSGTEDQYKPGTDSPFGSIISFGTSIPSPKPLRFCYNRKWGINHMDSPSTSSCLPSPTVFEDFGSSPMFITHESPRAQSSWPATSPPANHSTSMPFTEDLRKRLLIVNPNTPSSSTAASPTVTRSHPTNHVTHLIPSRQTPNLAHDTTASDNLLMIAPYSSINGVHSPWRENLEAIGEIPAVEKDSETDQWQNTQIKIAPASTIKKEGDEHNFKPSECTALLSLNIIEEMKSNTKRFISRSKSCSDVPISKVEVEVLKSNNMLPSAPSNTNNSGKDEQALVETGNEKPSTEKVQSFTCSIKTDAGIHYENEMISTTAKVSSSPISTQSNRISNPESSTSSSSDEEEQQIKDILLQDKGSRSNPFLLKEDTISNTNNEKGDKDTSAIEAMENIHPVPTEPSYDENITESLSDLEHKDNDTFSLSKKLKESLRPVFPDQGYCSAKEDIENGLFSQADPFLQIRNGLPSKFLWPGDVEKTMQEETGKSEKSDFNCGAGVLSSNVPKLEKQSLPEETYVPAKKEIETVENDLSSIESQFVAIAIDCESPSE